MILDIQCLTCNTVFFLSDFRLSLAYVLQKDEAFSRFLYLQLEGGPYTSVRLCNGQSYLSPSSSKYLFCVLEFLPENNNNSYLSSGHFVCFLFYFVLFCFV